MVLSVNFWFSQKDLNCGIVDVSLQCQFFPQLLGGQLVLQISFFLLDGQQDFAQCGPPEAFS